MERMNENPESVNSCETKPSIAGRLVSLRGRVVLSGVCTLISAFLLFRNAPTSINGLNDKKRRPALPRINPCNLIIF